MVQGVEIEDGHILNRNPATGELIERVPCSTPDQIIIMVEQAKEAQTSWHSDISLSERIALLKEGVSALATPENKESLAKSMTMEMGKVFQEAKEEADFAVDKVDFLNLIEKANGEEILQDDGDEKPKSIVVRDPLGVVAVMAPWNFPADEILLLALPALAAGNAVIVKPSEVTPLTGALVVSTLASKLPPNVLQLAQGDGTVGKLLVESDDVNMVAMTGSTAVGKSIMSSCSNKLKRIVLELGGKDPMIVFQDADLDKAAEDAVKYSLFNAGQVCCSVERVYVDQSIISDFEQKVLEYVSSYKVGNGTDPESQVGPLVSKLQRDHVSQQVEDAVAHGAKVLYRSTTPEATNASSSSSSFYPITVLSDLNQTMNIQKYETFGPVVALSTFDGTEEMAVKLANDTEYGLSSSVYSKDVIKAQRVGRKIHAGQVGINCFSLDNANLACPWVGHKNSGFGYHSGMDGFRQFSVPKSLVYTTP